MHRKTRTCLISLSRPPEDNNFFQPEILFFIFFSRGRFSLFSLEGQENIQVLDRKTTIFDSSSMIWDFCEELCSRGSTGSYRKLTFWPLQHYNQLLTCFQKDFQLLKIPFMAIRTSFAKRKWESAGHDLEAW